MNTESFQFLIGAIGRRVEESAKTGAIKVSIPYWCDWKSTRRLTLLLKSLLFQFLIGAIGRTSIIRTLVGLGVFQFLIGAIGRRGANAIILVAKAFQFLIGAIGRYIKKR